MGYWCSIMPGKIIVYKSIDDNGESYWPDQFPVEVLNRWYNEIGPISFASQYQSSPIGLSGNFLKEDYIHYYNHLEMPEHFDSIHAYIDPTPGESLDYFAMAVAGKLNNTIYLLELYRAKCALDAQKTIIDNMYVTWHPNNIIVESTGQQKYLVQYLEKNTMYPISTADTKWTQSGKDTRFATCAAHMNSRRALIPGIRDSENIWKPIESFHVFKNEWISYPSSGVNDDTLDAVSGAIESLIVSVDAGSLDEPANLQEAEEFIERVLNRNVDGHDRKLTDEERSALQDYYAEGLDMTIRRYGLYTGMR
jgi:phage terminase large subunit-like protein